jgi:hypothetical protein
MIPSTQLRTLLNNLTSGHRAGACVSPREVLEDLLLAMTADALATEEANKPKASKKSEA